MSTSKNAFPLTSLGTHLKEELTACFESYQRIPYSHSGRVDRGW